MGIVYVLTNAAYDRYVKIGETTDIEKRLKALDNTSVPLPFRCEYAIEVENHVAVEKRLHEVFDDRRVRTGREFFEVEPQRVIAAMKLAGGIDVTPRKDIEADMGGVEALNRVTQRRSNFDFAKVDIVPGSELVFAKKPERTATVVDARQIELDGKVMSLSAAALKLLHEEGYEWQTANGAQHWEYEGEVLSERRNRLDND